MSNSERVKMSYTEKHILQANKDLVEKQRILIKDISRLISYIKGNKAIENEVNNIMDYYTRKGIGTKYD